jgi:hypothetical protein
MYLGHTNPKGPQVPRVGLPGSPSAACAPTGPSFKFFNRRLHNSARCLPGDQTSESPSRGAGMAALRASLIRNVTVHICAGPRHARSRSPLAHFGPACDPATGACSPVKALPSLFTLRRAPRLQEAQARLATSRAAQIEQRVPQPWPTTPTDYADGGGGRSAPTEAAGANGYRLPAHLFQQIATAAVPAASRIRRAVGQAVWIRCAVG